MSVSVCMCVSVCVRACVCLFVWMCVSVCACMCVSVCACKCVCVRASVCACECLCVSGVRFSVSSLAAEPSRRWCEGGASLLQGQPAARDEPAEPSLRGLFLLLLLLLFLLLVFL